MSTCPITVTYSETFKVTQELHKTTNWRNQLAYETRIEKK